MEDAKIVALFYERKESALRELDKKYKHYCHKIASNVLAMREDVEECVSDSYLAVWQSIPPNKPKSLAAYLGKIVRNAALDKLQERKASKREAFTPIPFEEITEVFSQNSRDTMTDSIVLRDAINRFLKKLPSKKRILFMRRYFFFDSIEEIARGQKASESQIKTSLFRIRNELKQFLLEEGIDF